jgi:hypothetical protein
MTVIRGARERARLEFTAAIKEEARRQLAAHGAAKLSLRAVARDPQPPISRLAILTASERDRILEEWNDTERE